MNALIPQHNDFSPRYGTRGFTLLEILVVLVLASLVTTLLMQGLSHVANLRLRFLSQLELQQNGELRSIWFHRLCSAITPDQPTGHYFFSGNTKELHGLTLAPLLGEAGVPTPLRLYLEEKDGRIHLFYKERDGAALEIGNWSAADGGFSYLDSGRQWQRQWPPDHMGDNSPQLPLAIMLRLTGPASPPVWCAHITGRHHPRPFFRDLL